MEKSLGEDFGASRISTGHTEKNVEKKNFQIANEVKHSEAADGLGHLEGACQQIL